MRGQFVNQKGTKQGRPKHDRSGVATSDETLCSESDAEPDGEDCVNSMRHSQQRIHTMYGTTGIRIYRDYRNSWSPDTEGGGQGRD